jgi:PAS domain S-box-containing protein
MPVPAYLVSMVMTVAALMVAHLLAPVSLEFQSILLIPIALSAFMGGLFAAIFSILISVFGIIFFMTEPIHSFSVTHPGDLVECAAVATIGLLVSVLIHILQKARQEASVIPRMQDQWTKIAASVPGMIYSFRRRPDGSFCFPYASPTIETLFGYSAMDLSQNGHLVFDMIHPEDLVGVMTSIEESAKNLTVWHGEFRVRRLHGDEIWLEGQAIPTREPDGGVVWHGFAADVSTRKKSQQALAESHSRHHSLFVNMLEGCAYCRMVKDESGLLDCIILDVNPSFEKLTGLKNASGKRVSELVPGMRETNARLLEMCDRVSLTGIPQLLEEYIEPLKQWFAVSVYSPEKMHVVTIFEIITERKQNELVLRQSEERFRLLFDRVSKIAVQGYGPDGTVLTWNKASEELYGYTAAEAIGRNLVDLIIPPAMKEIVRKGVREMVESGVGIEADEIELMRKDGTLVPVFSNHTVINMQEGGKELYCIDIDLTERKKAEQELKRSQARLSLAVATVQMGVWEWDMLQNTLYSSHECSVIFGWESDQVAYEHFTRCIHPDDLGMVMSCMDEAIKNNHDFVVDYRIIIPKGDVRWVSDRGRIAEYHNNKPTRMIGTVQDITERKMTEQSLLLQSAALDAAANAIVITKPDGTIEWVNNAFSVSTGFSFAEAVGKNPRDLIKSGEQDAKFYSSMWTSILSGHVWRGEIVNHRKDGSLFTEDMTITPVRNELGSIIRFIAIKQDITEHKKNEEQMFRVQRLESVGRLASGIAHDLNNILAPMLIGVPILREVAQEPSAIEILDAIESSAERGASIIKQLLTFGRGMETRRVPIQLKSIVREMIKIIEETFPKNITVSQSIEPDLQLVNGDTTQIHQVLMNLCVNARDAMPSGGRLDLGLSSVWVDDEMVQHNLGAHVGPHVAIRVTDTGIGISREFKDKVYDPFFSTKPIGEGTGLGLSNVLGIVRNHTGFIQMDSELGKGTQFRVYLPVIMNKNIELSNESKEEPPKGNGETVLVVDDEENIRRMLRRILEKNGYRVQEAHNGAAALTLWKTKGNHIDVVLTDLLMPVMDGQTLIAKLYRANPSAKIISMSGCLTHHHVEQTVETSTNAFLPKPFSAVDLMKTMHLVLTT